jgi:lysophospholipase L1-like esterase
MANRIQYRRDTAAQWAAVNPILALGEPGIETDTKRRKVGDGTTAWNSLAYQFDKTLGDAAYAPILDTIVQNLPKVTDVYTLAPTPTVTLSAASAATSIAGGVDRVPKRKTVGAAVASPADLEDPNFRYIGAYTDSLAYGGSFPDYDYIGRTYLTGGASQAALIRPTYSFVYTGRYVEIKLKALTTRSLYMLKIDGKRVTEDAAVLTTVAGSIYRLIIDFGSAAIRKIEFLSENMNFGGVTIEPAASLYRGPKPRRIGMAFGDSISAGAGDGTGGASYLDTSAHRVLEALGCDAYVNTAIGGTRYTGPGSDMSTFINRLPDITAIAPDVLIVWGSYNDAAVATGAEIEAAATTFLNAVKAALPRTLVVVLGCHTPGDPTAATLWAANTAVKNAAATAGYPFVDVLDPLNLKATTPVWAATTAYRNGDIVQNNNALYMCIQGHTSTSSFDAAKFRGLSWINGTGKVGATTGLGNSDTFILADGVHPTLEGHTYLERRELEAIVAKLRQTAGH